MIQKTFFEVHGISPDLDQIIPGLDATQPNQLVRDSKSRTRVELVATGRHKAVF